jgi:hypothetical protein
MSEWLTGAGVRAETRQSFARVAGGVELMKLTAMLAMILVTTVLDARNAFAQEEPAFTFKQLSNETVQDRLRRFDRNNEKREASLKMMFVEAGCDGEHLTEQSIPGRKQKNLICTLEGTSDVTFIVGAHFDHVEEYGEGVVDNWSGASLLPSLFQGLKSQSMKHTFRFIGFAEDGLIGARFYAKQLKPDEVRHIAVMLDVDSLGLGPTKVWLTHSDNRMATILKAVANALNLPLDVMNADRIADEDSTPFRKLNVPTLMLHSITPETFSILHSLRDNLEVFRSGDYYDSYRLIAAYLSYLENRFDSDRQSEAESR